jgi:hypothetical protein
MTNKEGAVLLQSTRMKAGVPVESVRLPVETGEKLWPRPGHRKADGGLGGVVADDVAPLGLLHQGEAVAPHGVPGQGDGPEGQGEQPPGRAAPGLTCPAPHSVRSPGLWATGSDQQLSIWFKNNDIFCWSNYCSLSGNTLFVSAIFH